MAYIIDEPYPVFQALTATDTTQNHPFGKQVRAKDSTLGEGTFIYLKGVASTVVGSLVTYDVTTGVTTLSPNTGNTGNPVAVAMAACDATTKFGWYQTVGAATIKKTAVKFDPAVANKVFQSGTAGRIMQTSASGKQILGARFTSTVTVTSTTSTAVVQITWPCVQSNIT